MESLRERVLAFRPRLAAPTMGSDVAGADCEQKRAGRHRGWRRCREWLRRSGLTYLAYRYRYLAAFTVIGFLSILLELAVLRLLGRLAQDRYWATGVAFLVGMTFSFLANALLNFRVPRAYLLRTFGWFAAISTLSFALNMGMLRVLHGDFSADYGWLRLITAGCLFVVGYSLHRRYTFDVARNFGLAVYASEGEDPRRLYEMVGHNCDHIHVDLIDETMAHRPRPVCLENIATARRLWAGHPLALHIMSRRPRQWMDATWSSVDWYLIHLESEDDLWDVIFQCRLAEKQVGLVWRPGDQVELLLPYLAHVDFVMVLAIQNPGCSGQQMCQEALTVAAALHRLRSRYGFELMFDGGVKANNVAQIPAKYVVAASAVLDAVDPVEAAHILRSGARFRRAA